MTVDAMRFMGDVESFNAAAEFTGQSPDSDAAAELIMLRIFFLRTQDGWAAAYEGDWIVKQEDGSCFTCKPDVFEERYEAVRDD